MKMPWTTFLAYLAKRNKFIAKAKAKSDLDSLKKGNF